MESGGKGEVCRALFRFMKMRRSVKGRRSMISYSMQMLLSSTIFQKQ